MPNRALLVINDPAECALLESALTAAGLRAVSTNSHAEAAVLLGAGKFDCVFLEVHSASSEEIELARRTRETGYNQQTPIVMIAADSDPKLLARGFGAGASFLLYKPLDRKRVLRVIQATQGAIERERRRFRRVSVSQRVQIRFEQQQFEGNTLDLSLNGLFVQARGALPIGARIQVILFLDGGGEPLQTTGRVARVVGDDKMGIELESLALKESRRLENFLLPRILADIEREAAQVPA